MNRFGNGYIRQQLTSVDIEEILRVGGVVTEFLEGFVCDILDYNPFENFVPVMTAKKTNTEGEKKHNTNSS